MRPSAAHTHMTKTVHTPLGPHASEMRRQNPARRGRPRPRGPYAGTRKFLHNPGLHRGCLLAGGHIHQIDDVVPDPNSLHFFLRKRHSEGHEPYVANVDTTRRQSARPTNRLRNHKACEIVALRNRRPQRSIRTCTRQPRSSCDNWSANNTQGCEHDDVKQSAKEHPNSDEKTHLPNGRRLPPHVRSPHTEPPTQVARRPLSLHVSVCVCV